MKNKETPDDYGPGILHDAQIIIVDDQEANIHLLQGILEAAGYTRLVSTTNSLDVLSLMENSRPDLILLDLMMPEMDGFEVMEQLKPQIPREDYLPILVLTADVSPETKRRALSTGAADFVTKPFDRVEVLLRINNLLQTRFLHLELQRHNMLLEKTVRARTEHLTRALQQAVTAQETERRRLSMEIHDGALQSLGVCTMAVDRAIRRHERAEHALVLSGLREIRSSLTNTIDEVRGVLANLSLEILTSSGLAAALRDYVTRFSGMTGISVKVSLDDTESGNLPPKVQLLMYRLAQEGLSNVRKHAQAYNVELSLQVQGDHLYMSVTDDGKGFDVDAILNEHRAGEQIGLRSMRERIQSAQGDLWIDSSPGKGTGLRFWCPLSANTNIDESAAERMGRK